MNQKETEEKISLILERNARVEADKAWETSKTRRGLIFGVTYFITAYVFVAINVPNPFANALVPCTAYVVSTFSLPFIKKQWTKRIYRK
jgi:hypothetical protein